MKKSIIIIMIIIAVILIGLVIFFITKSKKINNIREIKIFHFSYSVGYHYEASIRYELECDDKCILKIKGEGISIEDAQVYEVNDETVKRLESILNKYKVGSWNGFDKVDKFVLDGDSFSLYIRMKNDETVEASGYMKWPNNYKQVREELDAFFKEIGN